METKVDPFDEFIKLYGGELNIALCLAAQSFFRNSSSHECDLCWEGVEHDTSGFVRKVEHG